MTVTKEPSRAAEWWRAQRTRVIWGVVIALVALVIAVLVARWLQ